MIVDRDFPDHWKTQLVTGRLGDGAPVGILRLWAHCEARRDDTFDMTPEVLKAVVRLPQNPDEIERALIEARWVARRGKKIVVLGWREKNRGLLANISNGFKGGRPRKNTPRGGSDPRVSDGEPTNNPRVSDGEPTNNPKLTMESRVEESREEASPRAHARTCERPGSKALILAKKRMCALLGLNPARLWSPDAEQGLHELGEIPESEWRVVEWLHRQPSDGNRRPKLRTTPTTLTRHWSDEVSKALAYARETGASIDVSEKNNAPMVDPEGWGEWLVSRGYPQVPFAEADPGVRREFREKNAPGEVCAA